MDSVTMPCSTQTTDALASSIATPQISLSSSSSQMFPATTPSSLPVTQFHYPPPYFVPYDSNLPYMQTFRPYGYPLYSLPIGQSSVPFGMLNSQPQGFSAQPASEQDKKTMDARMYKIARDKRKQIIQARRRSRSSTFGGPYIPESNQWYIRREPLAYKESNWRMGVTQNISSFDVSTSDGKKLEEILTKKLRKSDVGSLGRIILPKREAEEKLPPLLSKDGIDIVLQDLYFDQRWSMKYKYWSNNSSRMYVLENTGAFVYHHGLQVGDYVILYEDEFKNLYVLAKKEGNLEAPESLSSFMQAPAPDPQQAQDDEEDASMTFLIEEPTEEEELVADSFLNLCYGGGSSSGREKNEVEEQYPLPNNSAKVGSSQVPEQATEETATAPSNEQALLVDGDKDDRLNDGDRQNNNDEVYRELDIILDVNEHNFLCDHLSD